MTITNDLSLVTNWLDPIEKIYAKQSQQRERHHQQSQQVWKQEEAATFTTDKAVAALESVSKLSSSARKILKDRNKKLTQQFAIGYKTLPVATQELLNEVAIQKQDITKDQVDLITRLKQQVDKAGNRKISDEAIAQIKSLHGYNELRLNQIVGQQVFDGSVATITEQRNKPGDLQDSYIEAKRLGRVSEWVEGQQIQLLRNVGLNDDFIATEYLPQIKKFAKTQATLASLDFKNSSVSKENEENLALLQNIGKIGFDTQFGKDAAAQLVARMLKETGDRNKTMTFLYKATQLENGIDEKFIAAIKKGVIEGHPAAKFGKDLLSEDDWKFLEQGRRDFDLNKINSANAGVLQQLTTGVADLRNGDPVDRQYLLSLGASYGLKDTAIYKQLESYNADSLNPVIQQNESKRADSLIKSGNLKALKEFKDEIKNGEVFNRVEAEIKRQERLRADFGYDERWIDSQVSSFMKKSLAKDEDIHANGVGVRNDILAKFQEQWTIFSNEEPPNPNPFEAARLATLEYIEKNGGFTSGISKKKWAQEKHKVENVGKFTATSDGHFVEFNNQSKLIQKEHRANVLSLQNEAIVNRVDTAKEIYQYDTELSNKLDIASTDTEIEGNTTFERFLNTPESIVPNDQLRAILNTGKFSREFFTKCHLLRLDPFKALLAQINAGKKAGTLTGINEQTMDKFNKASHSFTKILTALEDDRDLVNVVLGSGFPLSPKKNARVLAILDSKTNLASQVETAHIEEQVPEGVQLLEEERRGDVKDVHPDHFKKNKKTK